jgi:hypothetical protein
MITPTVKTGQPHRVSTKVGGKRFIFVRSTKKQETRRKKQETRNESKKRETRDKKQETRRHKEQFGSKGGIFLAAELKI